MKSYRASYCRVENRVIELECKANSMEEAEAKFDEMIDDSQEIDFDEMECVHAEDFIQDIEEIK
jgi:pentatricopeptide repeat protein